MELFRETVTKETVISILKSICELDFVQENDEVYNLLNDALLELED